MSLNPTGSKPIISTKFGGIESGTCTLFIRKFPIKQWLKIKTITNNPFPSDNIVIDPSIYLGNGSSVSDLVGAEIRYNVLFLDVDGDDQINCSFDLEITQDGTVVDRRSDNKIQQSVEFIFFSQTFILI
jgi:hypothetical protein